MCRSLGMKGCVSRRWCWVEHTAVKAGVLDMLVPYACITLWSPVTTQHFTLYRHTLTSSTAMPPLTLSLILTLTPHRSRWHSWYFHVFLFLHFDSLSKFWWKIFVCVTEFFFFQVGSFGCNSCCSLVKVKSSWRLTLERNSSPTNPSEALVSWFYYRPFWIREQGSTFL